MRRPALVCGGLLLALGALSLLEALRVRDEWPGARLMPAVLAGVFAVLGAAHLASAAGDRVVEPPAWPEAPGWWRVGFVFAALALYVAALPLVGFPPATALFVLCFLRLLGGYRWAPAVGLAVAVALAGHVVFQRWLGMPLPAGRLGL